VTSDRQTLILAGETPPRRGRIAADRLAGLPQYSGADDTESQSDGQSSPQLTIISARVDAIVTHGAYRVAPGNGAAAALSAAANDNSANTSVAISSGGAQLATLANYASSLPSALPKLHQAYVISNRGASSAANAYARTRDLADKAPAIIDTYA
jgi:hypothetical protein